MGHILTKDEINSVQPHLTGFDPSALATVIWDAIREVNQDNKQEGLGIYFGDGPEETTDKPSKDSQHMVTFWDEGGMNQLPRKVFLEIMQFIGEHTIEEAMNTSGSAPEEDKGLQRLKIAMENLSVRLQTLQSEQGSAQYHQSLDKDECCNKKCSVAESDKMLDKLRVKNGLYSFMNSIDDEDIVKDSPTTNLNSPSSIATTTTQISPIKSVQVETPDHVIEMPPPDIVITPSPLMVVGGSNGSDHDQGSGIIRSKGIEAVVNRLPELRSRYERNLSNHDQSGDLTDGGIKQKMFGKFKILTHMKSIEDNIATSRKVAWRSSKQSAIDGSISSSTDEQLSLEEL